MKVKYLAALAAASVLGVSTLAGCAPKTEVETVEPDATEDVQVDVEVEPCAAPADAADPCAAE